MGVKVPKKVLKRMLAVGLLDFKSSLCSMTDSSLAFNLALHKGAPDEVSTTRVLPFWLADG